MQSIDKQQYEPKSDTQVVRTFPWAKVRNRGDAYKITAKRRSPQMPDLRTADLRSQSIVDNKARPSDICPLGTDRLYSSNT